MTTTFAPSLASRIGLVGALVAAAVSLAAPGAQAGATVATRTVLTVSSATNPTPAGQQVYLRAVVKPANRGVAPSGTVTFLDGKTALGSALLSPDPHGTEVAKVHRAFSIGQHSLTARYAGNATYGASQSPVASLQVTKAASKIVVSDTKGIRPHIYNIVAAVKPIARGTGSVPTGNVTITVDNSSPQTVALNTQGRAHAPVSLVRGTHTAHVAYSGDTHFSASTGDLTITVG